MHSSTTTGEAQRCVHATPAGTEWVGVVWAYGITTHRVGSDPPTLPTSHDSLPPKSFDKITGPDPQQSNWDWMDLAGLLIIESDFDFSRFVHRNIKVLVPPVRFGIMRPGTLGTVDLYLNEGVDACLRSGT